MSPVQIIVEPAITANASSRFLNDRDEKAAKKFSYTKDTEV
jgi:hypothetical protein